MQTARARNACIVLAPKFLMLTLQARQGAGKGIRSFEEGGLRMVLCELSKKTCCSPSAGIRPFKNSSRIGSLGGSSCLQAADEGARRGGEEFRGVAVGLGSSAFVVRSSIKLRRLFFLGGHSHFPRPTESFQNEHRNSRSGADSLLLQRRPW
jgi:hypothetical protein